MSMKYAFKLMKSTLLVLLSVFGFAVCNGAAYADYLYSPPFPKGKKFLVVQGFGGEKSHNTTLAYYAVDLAMAEGRKRGLENF